jgi:hypothetical protein
MQPRFRTGDRVLVLDLGKAGHQRTPFYVRGKTGEIFELCGCYLNPEDLAVGQTAGPAVPLYRVRFRQTRLWPDYAGSPLDTLCIEIYDHWLAHASPAAGAAPPPSPSS